MTRSTSDQGITYSPHLLVSTDMKRQTPWMTGNSFAKKDRPRSARIAIRVEPHILARVKARANADGYTLSEYIYDILIQIE